MSKASPMPAAIESQREARIRQIGAEILEQALARHPTPMQRAWWLRKMLEWSMASDRRRLQMFRFVDVLPSLNASHDITQRLREYLLDSPEVLPGLMALALRLAPPGTPMGWLAAWVARQSVKFMAHNFIAGETDAQAETAVMGLRDRGMGFSLDLLGEATTSEAQADAFARRYESILDVLCDSAQRWRDSPVLDHSAAGPLPKVNISVKLSALDPLFDPVAPLRVVENIGKRLRPILRKAVARGAHVQIDMEDYAHKDLILHVFKTIFLEHDFRNYPHVGIVLQAYLRECEQDLRKLIDWVEVRGAPITVRLVKGAYWDTEVAFAMQRNWPIPVFTQKWESDANFETLAATLFQHRRQLRPAIASHNVRSLAAALVSAEEVGAAPNEFEIQMLYGMADPLKAALVQRGLLMRIYTPFGPLIPGMGYLIRRLLENTSNESFLRHSFSERQPVKQLLRPPELSPNAAPQIPPILVQDPLEEEFMSEPFVNEPPVDFGVEANRRTMEEALEQVRRESGDRIYPMLIDGRHELASTTIVSFNPSHREMVLGRVACASKEHADAAVEAAQRGFQSWRRLNVSERATLIRGVAEAMRRRKFELAAWIVTEAGKPWREADADVAEAIDFCLFYSRLFEEMHERPRRRDLPGEKNLLVYEGRGVALIISPWNFPLAILTGMAVAALVTGNTVIVKPAEQTSIIAYKLFELLEEAGIPHSAAHFLPGIGEEVGAYLVGHPGIDLIAFTGSRTVGLQIIETAARTSGSRGPKKVIAEMGGKNAIIIDTDADLDEAVKGILASAFGYAGQKCSACSRVIVTESVRPALLQRLKEALKSVPVGPAEDPSTVVGPLIDEEAMKRVRHYVELGRKEGHVVVEVDPGLTMGWYACPVILDEIKPESRMAREEIFGPVVVVMSARSFEEAIAIANDTDYALTGGLYSRSPANIERAKTELNVGNLYINREITGAKVDRQPFGGFKMSGVGSKAGGPDYLLQFTTPKAITENTVRHGLT